MRAPVSVFLVVSAATLLIAQTVNYSYDSAGRLVQAKYSNGKVLSYNYDPAGNLLRSQVLTPGSGAAPTLTAAGVLNAASFLGGAVSPGEVVTIFGSGLGPANLVLARLTSLGLVDDYLSETSVFFDGVPAPLIYASAGQTTAVVPYSVAGRATTQIVVQYQGVSSAPVSVPVAAAAPGLVALNSSGRGNGAILNEDNSVNGPGNPATKGSVVVLWGTGEGQTTPRGSDGHMTAGTYPKPLLAVSVSIGGAPADVLYAGSAPSLVAGVLQVNARVPQGIASGAVPVVVTVGTASSQSGLTVSIQ